MSFLLAPTLICHLFTLFLGHFVPLWEHHQYRDNRKWGGRDAGSDMHQMSRLKLETLLFIVGALKDNSGIYRNLHPRQLAGWILVSQNLYSGGGECKVSMTHSTTMATIMGKVEKCRKMSPFTSDIHTPIDILLWNLMKTRSWVQIDFDFSHLRTNIEFLACKKSDIGNVCSIIQFCMNILTSRGFRLIQWLQAFLT